MDDIGLDSPAMLYSAVVMELALEHARAGGDAKELLLADGALVDVWDRHR